MNSSEVLSSIRSGEFLAKGPSTDDARKMWHGESGLTAAKTSPKHQHIYPSKSLLSLKNAQLLKVRRIMQFIFAFGLFSLEWRKCMKRRSLPSLELRCNVN